MPIQDRKFQRAIIASVIIHFIVPAIFLFSLPSMFKPLPTDQEVMIFEVVNIKDIPNIKTERKSFDKNDKAVKPNLNKQTTMQSRQEKQIIDKTIDKPEDKKIEKPEEIKLPIKSPVTPKIKEKKEEIKKPTSEKKTDKPKVKVQEEDSLDSILNDLEKSMLEDESKVVKDKNKPTGKKTFFTDDNFNEEAPISITEKMLIKKQIQEKWHKPVSALNVQGIRIVYRIEFEKNGAIKEAQYLETICPPGRGDLCSLTKETIERAIKSINIIENLPPHRYDIWRNVTIDFNPYAY